MVTQDYTPLAGKANAVALAGLLRTRERATKAATLGARSDTGAGVDLYGPSDIDRRGGLNFCVHKKKFPKIGRFGSEGRYGSA